jgi:glycine/D-amino acid oxidase-like deaminating enzyme
VHAEVVIVGAGSAGCVAALAAARAGRTVLLIDRLGFPGGTSTAVLDTFYAFFTAGEAGRKVVSGLPDLPVQRLRARGKVFERPNSFGSGLGYTYDPETLKIVWAELLREHGVTLMLHSLVTGVRAVQERVEALTVATRAGLVEVTADAFVDASGDADVIAAAGGAMLADRELLQPATVTFRMAPVDLPAFREHGRPRFRELLRQAREQGYDLRGDSGSLHQSGAKGVALMATTRIDAPDLADPLEPGRVELEGLEQVDEWARFLRDQMPGFEQAELVAIGAMAGVRETRRIQGRYVLTEEDVRSGASFDDQIARCGAPIEDLASADTRWVHVGGPGTYGLPWRCLVPKRLRGVVVAGRCLSATHSAHASARSMATCMAMGQAAGTAAGLAVEAGVDVSAVDGVQLRDRLATDGADVGATTTRSPETQPKEEA